MQNVKCKMQNAKCGAVLCAVLFVLARPPLIAQEGVKLSTMTAGSQKDESTLMLNLAKDSRESLISLDYSIRWDFSDLAQIHPSFRTLVDGISAIGRWDITENTRVKYYGIRTNPWRLFIARERVNRVPEAGGGSQITAAGPEAPVYKKRLRLSISPLVDDFKRELDENLRNLLLQNSLKATGPQWGKVSTQGKKSFFSDVLSLEIWDLPVLDTTKQGLEYISK
ncbi:MAG: hypothetical protein A2270_08520 [Elusimicrobia bacterium RIFOXYA12_FULL_51_18]|nr:MAG: hypothetical protein A2270_08520 [Elusimicrobia bacterium RIFOXYA12_FULL_51_18]OGS28668.1 MAG: hypothetical protein A2218_09835 [Elusimicrobia bacterium RIFOXYA2_FULL_53_38]